MAMQSINPATGELLKEFETWDDAQVEAALARAAAAAPAWRDRPVEERCDILRKAAQVLRAKQEEYARTASLEMGKRISEARGEIEKCAAVCDYYADEAPTILANEMIESDAGKSYVAYQPLGTVLAVMPWNYPFWQVLRFAAPALAAGNTGLLKHASNVPQCALAIEEVFREAGAPAGVFISLMIGAARVKEVIEDPRVHAVTITGSEPAGRQVAAAAGAALKKTVLELGGSDPFVVLEDADQELAIQQAMASRYGNCGQSCIAAKRFIVIESIADEFVAKFKTAVEALHPGDPLDESTTIGPMAREDLRDELHGQVTTSVKQGAVVVTGCQPLDRPGAYFAPSIIDHVKPGIDAYTEEFFGPVAIVIRAKDEAEAVRIANDSPFGLGSSVWTKDSARGERVALQLQAGAAFVNGMVKSDPRLPFGGIKNSGYGRELSHHGMQEFLNAKTVWIR